MIGEVSQLPRVRTNDRARIAQLEMRMTGCEQALSELPSIKADAQQARENTEQIIGIISGGKSAVKFAQKHGGRVVAALIGYLAATGHLGPELAKFFSSLFGLQ
jgi:S-formylglutathione hydrolase FrmB